MIGITNAGGGKDRLRFRLFAGQNPPNNPKQADVFVRTNVLPINEWQLRGEAHPLPWLEQETDIVIQTSSSPSGSAFVDIFNSSANNKGRIYEKFMSCIQQVSGKWVKREAYVWNKNKWVQFSTTYNGELFYQGNQFTDVTRGWNSFGVRMYPWNEGWGGAAPTMEFGTNMVVYQSSNPNFGTIFTGTSIDVTKYRALKANVQYNLRGAGYNNGFWLGVTTETNDQYHPLASFMAQTDTGEKSYDGDISIDISGITGRVFVFIAVVRHSHVSQFGTNPVTFRKIWLE